MRVITGSVRGRKLKDVPGLDTRPTTDKVKEAMFSIVQFDIEGRTVLDLFAGTGQLGIEALSRGAARCVFVEENREAVRVIRQNLTTTGLLDRAEVIQGDSLAYLGRCREKFGLAFFDPPYASSLLEEALARATAIDIMTENGIIICESTQEKELPPLPAPYETGRTYRYGKMKLTLCHRRSV